VRSPLTTRTIALGALVAVLVAAAFVVVASSAREARRSSDAAQRAQAVTISAVALGQLADRLDAAVRGYIHDDDTRKDVLGACRLADDASAPKDAVNLNNLDDWYEFHRAVLA